MKEKIVWTLLPHGVAEGKLQFSLVASPQLTSGPGNEHLDSFHNWVDWPKTVSDIKFKVLFSNGTSADAKPAKERDLMTGKVVGSPIIPDSKLWKQLFANPSAVRVAPFDFNEQKLDDRLIFSYPVSNVLNYVRNLYTSTVWLSPTSFPSKLALWTDGGMSNIAFYPRGDRNLANGGGSSEEMFQKLHDDLVNLMRRRNDKLGNGRPANAMPPTPPNPGVDFYQLHNYYQPRAKKLPNKSYTNAYGRTQPLSGNVERLSNSRLKSPDGIHSQDDLDFHQVISAMGSYPLLMRHLGLVIDLEVETGLAAVTVPISATGPTVQIEVHYGGSVPNPHPDQVRPKVLYQIKGDVFEASPKPFGSEISPYGFLILNDPKQKEFEIVQVDVDGAGIKLMNTAYNLVQSTVRSSVGSSENSSLATLRSAGFSIAHTGLAYRTAASFASQAELYNTGGPEPMMSADDVVSGYRMDVWSERTKKFHSLYEREGQYDFGGGIEIKLTDEAFSQLAPTSAADGSSSELFLNEAFVRWKGWSLAVQKPGTKMDNSGTAQDSSTLNPPNPNYALHPKFSVPSDPSKRLPALRFGERYRLRVRTVNLAGNSVPLDTIDALEISDPKIFQTLVTEPERYSRFDPVSSPTVVLHEDLTQYQPNSTIATNLQKQVLATPPAPPPAPQPATAPKPPVIEWPNTSAGEALERIVIRTYNDGTFVKNTDAASETSSRHFAPPKTGIELADHHGMLDIRKSDWNSLDTAGKQTALAHQYTDLLARADGNFSLGPKQKMPDKPPATGLPDSTFQKGALNPLVTSDKLDQLPYLPDPIAKGVSLIGVPFIPPGTTVFGIPQMTPGAIEVYSSTSASQSLTMPTKDTLIQLEYPRDTSQWFDVSGVRVQLNDATGVGTAAPSWDQANRLLTIYLNKADTSELLYSSYLDIKALELMGLLQWLNNLYLSNPPAALTKAVMDLIGILVLQGRNWMITPFRVLKFVHAVQKPLQAAQFSNAFASTKFLGDTFATLVDTLSLEGKSTGKIDMLAAWTEPVDDLSEPTWKTVNGSAHVFEQNIAQPTTTTLAINNPHHFGDTKHRNVDYSVKSTTRFKEYFPDELTKDQINISVDSTPKTLNILSSKRPAAPDLLYMVPVFGWTEPVGHPKNNPRDLYHGRLGNAVRVYMNRPWFSSGDEECLGVLVWTDQFSKIPEKYLPFVTQWGMDPIWTGGVPTGAPGFNSFPLNNKKWQAPVSLDEVAAPSNLLLLEKMMIKPSTKLSEIKQTGGGSQSGGVSQSGGGTTDGGKTMQAAKLNALEQYVIDNGHKKVNTNELPTNSLQHLVDIHRVNTSEVNQLLPSKLQVEHTPTLVVIGHDVHYDSDRQLWYSDIMIDPGPTYTPFVRLALTRFQPNSVNDAFVSRVIVADFVQLLPNRAVAIICDPTNPKLISIVVSGQTYTNADGRGHKGSQFEVSVEVARPDITDDTEELRWMPIPDSTFELVTLVNKDGTGAWTGGFTLPEPRGSRPYRLLIKEYERFLGEDDRVVPGATLMMQKNAATTTTIDPNKRRLVFADTLEI